MREVRYVIAAVVVAACMLAPRDGAAQVMDARSVSELRARLPTLAVAEWDADLQSPAVLWYTEREMPRAYQHAGGFHSPGYNISADPSDSGIRHGEGGNANVQFPWRHAGGLDRSPDATTVTGLLLPARENGSRWPVVVWDGRLPGHPGMGPERAVRWMFPTGTVLFEVVSHPVGGVPTVCEVRARLREIDSWGVGLFRPIPSAVALAAELERIHAARFPREIAQLRGVQAMHLVDVTDRANRTRPAFSGVSGAAFVPELPVDVVQHLLSLPFRDCLGAEWARGPRGEICYAPTTASTDQIVPRGWMGSLVGTDSDTCSACHRTVAQHARHFDAARGWYGHVRGDDDVFSFHPIAPESVSRNGATLAPRLRPELVRAGVVERYDPAKHPASVYRQLNWPARRQ